MGELQSQSEGGGADDEERSGGTRSERAERSRGGSDEASMEDRRHGVWVELAPVLEQGLRYLARRPVSTGRGSPVTD